MKPERTKNVVAGKKPECVRERNGNWISHLS